MALNANSLSYYVMPVRRRSSIFICNLKDVLDIKYQIVVDKLQLKCLFNFDY